MADPTITNAAGVTRVTLKSTVNASVGDLIGHDGTDWVSADADARIAARFMAMENVPVGGTLGCCESGVLFDSDAPYTAGASQYLSITPARHGAIPAISATLTIIQRIGHAISTDTVVFNLARVGNLYLRARATYDPASLAAVTARSDTVTLTGLLTTDNLRFIGAPAAGVGWDSGLVVEHLDVSLADTLRIRLVNPSAAALDGASNGNFDVLVLRP